MLPAGLLFVGAVLVLWMIVVVVGVGRRLWQLQRRDPRRRF
ncbi:MAG: hypothetical protein ACXVJ7_18635 [Acidimicrobiia bacterium]